MPRELAARVVERLAVQGQPGDGARRAEVRAAEAEIVGETAGGRPVDDCEEAVAEVEQHDGVVVGVGGDEAARELPLAHADPRERGDRHGGAEDPGQRVERVDRHVVERPTARSPEVPARIDRRAAAADPLGLLLVIRAERRAADRPADPADRAASEQAPDLAVVRSQHLARRGDDLELSSPCELDQLGRLGLRERHRLVEVDVLPASNARRPCSW